MKARAIGFLFKDGNPIPVNRPDLSDDFEKVKALFEAAVNQEGNGYTGYMFIVEGQISLNVRKPIEIESLLCTCRARTAQLND